MNKKIFKLYIINSQIKLCKKCLNSLTLPSTEIYLDTFKLTPIIRDDAESN